MKGMIFMDKVLPGDLVDMELSRPFLVLSRADKNSLSLGSNVPRVRVSRIFVSGELELETNLACDVWHSVWRKSP